MSTEFVGVTRTMPIRVDDLDGGGIVYHGRFVAILDHAISDFWVERGWTMEAGLFPVVRALTFEFLAPISSLGHVDVRFSITKCGRTSATYAFEFIRGDVVHARGERTNVFVDKTGRPVPIRDEIWELAAPLLAPGV